MRILVAEDEKKVQRFLRDALESAGMTVDTVSNLPELLAALEANPYFDAIVLDRMLERQDALLLIPSLRKKQPELKILVLSAFGEPKQRVEGLEQGADDYLAKPFHLAELVARLRALHRRDPSSVRNPDLKYEDLTLDLDSCRAVRNGTRIDLTKKEFQILSLLIRRPGKVFSKMRILEEVWDLNHHPDSNIVEVMIANLRNKIDRGQKPLIHSQRGLGYWLGKE